MAAVRDLPHVRVVHPRLDPAWTSEIIDPAHPATTHHHSRIHVHFLSGQWRAIRTRLSPALLFPILYPTPHHHCLAPTTHHVFTEVRLPRHGCRPRKPLAGRLSDRKI